MSYIDTIFCHYAHVGVYCNIIRLIKADLSYLQQNTSNLCFLFFCKFQTIHDKISWEFKKVRLKFPLYPYTMLQTDNIAWCKFCSLFLNIVKRGKGRETQDFGGANDLSLLASWASFNKDNGDCYHIYINYLTEHKAMPEPPYRSETPEF